MNPNHQSNRIQAVREALTVALHVPDSCPHVLLYLVELGVHDLLLNEAPVKEKDALQVILQGEVVAPKAAAQDIETPQVVIPPSEVEEVVEEEVATALLEAALSEKPDALLTPPAEPVLTATEKARAYIFACLDNDEGIDTERIAEWTSMNASNLRKFVSQCQDAHKAQVRKAVPT